MIKLILSITKPRSIFQLNNDYENELKRCIKFWRKNAGKIKDIEIHISIDYDFNTEIFRNYKNVYFHKIEYKLNDKFGYAVVHEGGKYFQKLFPTDILIHIDLDMCCLKPIPTKWLLKTTIGAYRIFSDCKERIEVSKKYNINIFTNTDLIITPPGSTYYNDYCKCFEKNKDNKNFWAYEEFISDLIIRDKNYNIVYGYEAEFN